MEILDEIFRIAQDTEERLTGVANRTSKLMDRVEDLTSQKTSTDDIFESQKTNRRIRKFDVYMPTMFTKVGE